MPIYEYQCISCGDVSEVMQRMSDPPLTTCDDCGGALKKLVSAPAFQFKGDGWYVTDYARKNNGKDTDGKKDGAKSEATSDSKSEAKSEAKSDSKPEAKPDSKPEGKSTDAKSTAKSAAA